MRRWSGALLLLLAVPAGAWALTPPIVCPVTGKRLGYLVLH
jgi:hypothetical protein